jgi:SAM-dependent methyltransferase
MINTEDKDFMKILHTIAKKLFGWQRRDALRKALGGKQEMCWVRTVSDEATRDLIRGLPLQQMKVLEISGRTWREWPFGEYRSVDFPEYDVCAEPLLEKFDLIIAEQVFEHLLWPYKAGRNVFEMLKPGGYFMISTPFLVPIHDHPVDCSRWTEVGLKHFLAECGFPLESVKTGSWGNRSCVKANLQSFLYYRQNWHSLKNEYRFPVSVWALARKAI